MLEKGKSYRLHPEDPESLSLMEFEKSRQNLDLKGLRQSFSLRKKSDEKILRSSGWIGNVYRAKTALKADLTAMELHKRLSLPATCLLLFPGSGTGLETMAGGRLGGYGLSLVLLLAYYFLLVTGEQKAMQGSLAPWLAMWLPNLTILIVGLYFFARALRKDEARVNLPLTGLKGALSGLNKRFGFLRKKTVARARTGSAFPSLVDRYVFSRFFRLLFLAFLALLVVMAAVTFILRLELSQGNEKT